MKTFSRRSWCATVFSAALALTPLLSFANGPAPTRQQARFEIDFMTDMIDHHAMAVMMASVCIDKEIRPELHQLCENIIASQSAEIEMMQSWLQDWYGVTHEPEMKPGDQRMMERMSELSGVEFEIMFMDMMIRHHRKAVREGETCIRRAYHPGLVALCHDIMQSQSEEIALMQSWLCQWYQRCRGSQ